MILVGSTIPAYKLGGDSRYWDSWLSNAEALREAAGDAEVRFFATVETDARGLVPFVPLLERLTSLATAAEMPWYEFSIDDGAASIDTGNRLMRICTGLNLIAHHAVRAGATHVFWRHADIWVPDDSIPKLLELDQPLVGGNIPTYCLTGPRSEFYPEEWDVREHMNVGGFLLARREVFARVPWRADGGMTDDPCYHADALDLGFQTFVRHDLEGRHWPEAIPPIEDRGHDLTIH